MPACADAVATASRGDWQEVFTLLDTALELDPAARAAWLADLDGLGPEQARLSPLLHHLLAAHAEIATGEFLRAPPTFVFGPPMGGAGLAAQALVGPYRLLREIGQGGMASVWLAERADGLLDRRIALKLPHPGWGDAPRLTPLAPFTDRMARERNILASLTHPHIARLYDAGLTDEGRPYLALEYVDGEPIDAYAATHGLGLRERIELVVQVARAVAHAHARLVVHRDLKPSNILVDAAGQAHLLDFGIAALVDAQIGDVLPAATLAPALATALAPALATALTTALPPAPAVPLTQSAGRALTPDYASPEQIRGDAIGTASDVYSLGVVLFELLAGARPYRLERGLGAAALADAIERVEVPAASTIATDAGRRRQLEGDLDAILARALAKASGDRYRTMDALADDLERHLRGEPVQARPHSHWYHAERWVRRHKIETAIALALPVAALGGAYAQVLVLLALAAGATVALWQRNRALAQAERARVALDRAEQVKGFIASIFTHAVPHAGRGGAVTAVELLAAAALRVEADLAGQPEVAAELGLLIGAGFNELGDMRAALDWLPKVVERCTRALGATHRFSLQSRWRLAEAANSLGELALSEALLPALVNDVRNAQPPAPALLVAALKSQAFVHAKRAREPAAMAALNEAVEVATRQLGAASEAALGARASLSNTFVHFGRFTEALQAIEPALAPTRAAFGALRPHPFLTMMERNHADALARCERPRDAAVLLRQVLADQRALDVVETIRVRITMTLLAHALLLGGHLDEAESLLIEAQALHQRLTAGENHESIGLAVRLSTVCALRGDGEAALLHIARADALAERFGEAEAHMRTRASARALAQATAGQSALVLAATAAAAAAAATPVLPPSALAQPSLAEVRTLRARAMALRQSGLIEAAAAAAGQAVAVAARGASCGLESGLALAEAARCSAALGLPLQARQQFLAALAAWQAAQVDGPQVLRPVQLELAALPAA